MPPKETITDIHSKRGLLRIEGAKGKKDRYSLLSTLLLGELRTYYKQYRPKIWLFEGPVAGTHHSPTSIAKILDKASVLAGIGRRVPPTCCGIRLRQTCSSKEQICRISRNCWDIVHRRRQKSTRMFPNAILKE
jgi:integrase